MNFYIYNIRVTSITSLGSLNIGNTILSGNRSTEVTASGEKEAPAGAYATEAASVEAAPGEEAVTSQSTASGYL